MYNKYQTTIFQSGNNNYQEINTNNYFYLESSNAIENLNESYKNDRNAILIRYYDEKKKITKEKFVKKQYLNNLFDFNYIFIDGNPICFLLSKDNLKYQNKIDLLTKEIKNAKYKNGLLEILNFDLNKVNFELKERKSNNQFTLNKIYDNRNLINNDNRNNNFPNNNNQNEIDQLPRKPNGNLNNYNSNNNVQYFGNNNSNNNNNNNQFNNNNNFYNNNNINNIYNNSNNNYNNNKIYNNINNSINNNNSNLNNNNNSNNNYNNCDNNNNYSNYLNNNNNNINNNINNNYFNGNFNNNSINDNNNSNYSKNNNYNNSNSNNNYNNDKNNFNNNNNINSNFNNSNNYFNNNTNINYNFNNNNNNNNYQNYYNNFNHHYNNNYSQNQYNMNNNRNAFNNNNNKMNVNFLNFKTGFPNNNNNKMMQYYGFNNQNNNSFSFNRNNNWNNYNFQNNQNNNSNINNNMNSNNQFSNPNNNFGPNFINNYINNNINNSMNQSQGSIQINNNSNINYKEMLSKFLIIFINKNSINNNIYFEIQNLKNSQYLFFTKGLDNIGSTCFMNATLQCLLHVNELVSYFQKIYPKDSNSLNKINKDVDSKGQISKAFFNVIKGVSSNSSNNNNRFSMFNYRTNYNSFSPDEFKRTIGKYNRQFKRFEANDSKDLILYLFQTIHEELNYLGNNSSLPIINRPNQTNENDTFNYFLSTYNMRNFSIISDIFYGTYKNITTCKECNSTIYNFQKFEFLSFGMFDYQGSIFNLYNGLDDNERQQQLKGDNQFYCNKCKKLCDAEVTTKIIEAPDKLLINIDYGKNKRFQPSAVIIDDPLDLKNHVIGHQQKLMYNLIGVCKHLGHSGSTGHYIAYCKNKEKNIWYKFNDSIVTTIKNNSEISQGNPYLLLYEKIK